MKYIKLFENFDEFKSEVEFRRSKSDNWSIHNLEDLMKDANSIRMFMKEGSVTEVLNLLGVYILGKSLYDKKIPMYGSVSPSKTMLYYYFLYLIDSNRTDVLDRLYGYLDKVSGKLSEGDKQDLLDWLENSRKVSDKESFYNLINSI